MSKNTDLIKRKIQRLDRIKVDYITSSDFAKIADRALENFIKRVRRGLMPDLSDIRPFKAARFSVSKSGSAKSHSKYIQLRRDFSFQLGEQGKPDKSNATATGQMLEAMAKEITNTGFKLIVKSVPRQGELGDKKSTLKSDQVATYYQIKRPIFEFSEPEKERMTREVKRDLLKLIREATKGS